MKNILTLILAVFSWTITAQNLPKVASGSLKRIESFPSKYLEARNVDIWLPEGYNTKTKYAVLYMHDGQMLFDSTTTWNKQEWSVDETLGKLMSEKKIKNCIVVGVWNNAASRHADYFPQKPFESLPQNFQDSLIEQVKRDKKTALFSTKVQSDAYLKFLVTELKPFIDSVYSTNSNRKNTFIAGSSMGGLISMYAICEYPSVFGGAACLSTHWIGIFSAENNPIPDAFFNYLKTHLPNPKQHKIYFDYGTKTLDAYYEPFQLKADAIMKANGFTEKNWITRKYEGDDHSEKSWRERLDVPILFLLGN
jgi:predicted alpha/beta superfamily hydrolase